MSVGGRAGGGRIPSIFPSGLNIKHINDGEILEIIKQEKETLAKIDAIKSALREVNDKKDAALIELQKTTNSAATMNSKGSDEFYKLVEQKKKLRTTQDELIMERNKLNALRDELELLRFEVKPLEEEIFEAKEKVLDSEHNEDKILEQQATAEKSLSCKSLEEAEEAIKHIDTEIEKVQMTGNEREKTTLLNGLNKQKVAAEKVKNDLLSLSKFDDRLTRERKKHTILKEQLKAKEEKLAANLKQQEDLRANIAAFSDIKKKFDSVHHELKDLNDKMDVSNAKNKETREANVKAANDGPRAVVNKLGDEQKRLRNERDALTQSLENLLDIVNKKFKKEFHFNPEHRRHLIGTRGATIDTLMQDFGVSVYLDNSHSNVGSGIIFGPPESIEECSAAIDQIIASAVESNQVEVIDFDPQHSRAFIGIKGSNVARIQTASGAQIKLAGDKITITGTKEAIEAAKVLISEFHDSTATDEISFDPKITDILIGQGGATIRRIERESGVKSIRMNKETSVLTFSGHKDCVEKAKAAYLVIINNMMDNTVTIPADEKIIRTVVGSQGKTIREIEKESGAIVTAISKGSFHSIVIRGTKEQVKDAKRMIEDVAFKEEIKIPFDVKFIGFLTSRPIVEVDENENESTNQSNKDNNNETELSDLIAKEEDPTTNVIVVDNDQEGKKKRYLERLSPLEVIKKQCDCEQISTIRSEGMIVIRGRADAVNKARDLLTQVLNNHVPATVNIPYPAIIYGYLSRAKTISPTETGNISNTNDNKRMSQIDIIFEKYKHDVISIDVDRNSKCINIVGTPTSTTVTIESVVEDINTLISSCDIRHVPVPTSKMGAVIGTKGAKIRTIQETTNCEIELDKVNEVALVFSPIGDTMSLERAVEMITEFRDG